MAFVKQDMSFIHYRWDMEEEPASVVFCGEPSRRIFDRFNGAQVLFLINCCARIVERFSLKDARMLESRIAHQLPPGLKSERSVYNWILQTIKVSS